MSGERGRNGLIKSLLISSSYYPPDVGGISQYMSSMVSALGPDRVCCLTGVRAQVDQQKKRPAAGVYRRPLAFAKPKYLQAVGWAAAVAEIVVPQGADGGRDERHHRDAGAVPCVERHADRFQDRQADAREDAHRHGRHQGACRREER